MEVSSLLLTKNKIRFFAVAFFFVFAGGIVFGQQIDAKGLLLIELPENRRKTTETDHWLPSYISMVMRASMNNAFDGYRSPSRDLTNLWRKYGEEAKAVNSIQIQSSFQYFNDLYFIRFRVNRNGISQDYSLETDLEQLIPNLKKLFKQISPGADSEIVGDFPALEGSFLQILSLESKRLNEGLKIEIPVYRDLIREAVNFKRPEPFLLLAFPLSLSAYSRNLPDQSDIYGELELIAEDFSKRFPETSELSTLIALLNYLRNKNYDLMEKYSRIAIDKNVNDDTAALILALSLGLNTGEGKTRLAYLESIHPWLKNSKYSKEYLDGVFFDRLNQEKPANQLPNLIEQIEAGDEISNTKNPDYDIGILDAKMALQNGNSEKAEEILQGLVQKYPEEKEGFLLLSGIYLENREHIKNIDLLEKSAFNEEPEFQKRIGNSYFALKDWPGASKTYDAYLAKKQEDSEVLEKAAITYINLNNPDRADEYLDKALLIEPNRSEIWRHKGEVAFRRGLKSQARIYWKRAIALDPQNEKAIRRMNETE